VAVGSFVATDAAVARLRNRRGVNNADVVRNHDAFTNITDTTKRLRGCPIVVALIIHWVD